MPDMHLAGQEIDDIISFLTWVKGIDTNDWPPKPMATTAASDKDPGKAVFMAQGCSACHAVGGVGGNIGPDLTKIGDERSRAWLEEQIEDPKLHDPASTMPSYAKLPEKDREELADYLSKLR
ncbi:MAG: c-type cytochrome, partial [Dissulfurimicrobium hydrothermale]|uniref:c-type cytochrome n=1 Tax=Dissulfurimicrobium hydrothermale TaxID=1750598 RepID=UPI003C776FE7